MSLNEYYKRLSLLCTTKSYGVYPHDDQLFLSFLFLELSITFPEKYRWE